MPDDQLADTLARGFVHLRNAQLPWCNIRNRKPQKYYYCQQR